MNETTQRILKSNNYMILSTTCEDGAPWGTPMHFAYDEQHIYWLSHTETQHSENISRNNRVFVVVFNSQQVHEMPEDRGAVYVSTVAELLEGDEALAARDVYSNRFPDDNGRHAGEWGVYRAAIGVVNEEKTVDQMIYYHGI